MDEFATIFDKMRDEFSDIACGICDMALAFQHREAAGCVAEDGFGVLDLISCEDGRDEASACFHVPAESVLLEIGVGGVGVGEFGVGYPVF